MPSTLDRAATCEERGIHPEALEQARRAVPDEARVARASSLLKAVSDPTRLRILAALAATELCVCDLAALTGTSESAVSHQLRLLREERLVAFRKEGRMAYYRLMDHHVTELIHSALEHAQKPGGTAGSALLSPSTAPPAALDLSDAMPNSKGQP